MEAARRVSKAALWGHADTADELTERICPSIWRSEISTAQIGANLPRLPSLTATLKRPCVYCKSACRCGMLL
jgi:hypothetical protein